MTAKAALTTRHRVNFATLCWLLIPVIALHNFEEWLTLPHYGEMGGMVSAMVGIERPETPWPVLQVGLILVTIVPALVIAIGVLLQSRRGDWLVCTTGSIYLANVFLPHIPAAIWASGYTPGLITAVGVTLPFMLLLMKAALNEHRLSRSQILGAIAVGALMLPIGLMAALATAKGLVE